MPGIDSRKVKRWDVYDIADQLADVPGLLEVVVRNFPDAAGAVEIITQAIKDLEQRLWRASERGGVVGPWPAYSQLEA